MIDYSSRGPVRRRAPGSCFTAGGQNAAPTRERRVKNYAPAFKPLQGRQTRESADRAM